VWTHRDGREAQTAYIASFHGAAEPIGTWVTELIDYASHVLESPRSTRLLAVDINLTQFKGQTVTIQLVGVEDSGSITSFLVDDFAM
jgi:hypothetical protein